MRLVGVAIVLCAIAITGCEQQCDSSVALAVLKVEDSHRPSYGSQPGSVLLTENLRELLERCNVSEAGLSIAADYVLSAPEVYILADDIDRAEEALAKTLVSLDDRQTAQLLGTAARYGDLSILKSIVEGGVDPTLRDVVGNNALMAIPGGREPRIAKIEFLLGNDLELDYQTEGAFSVLDVAIFSGDKETLVWLLGQLDKGNDGHFRVVNRSLEIATTTDSPFSAELDEWLN